VPPLLLLLKEVLLILRRRAVLVSDQDRRHLHQPRLWIEDKATSRRSLKANFILQLQRHFQA